MVSHGVEEVVVLLTVKGRLPNGGMVEIEKGTISVGAGGSIQGMESLGHGVMRIEADFAWHRTLICSNGRFIQTSPPSPRPLEVGCKGCDTKTVNLPANRSRLEVILTAHERETSSSSKGKQRAVPKALREEKSNTSGFELPSGARSRLASNAWGDVKPPKKVHEEDLDPYACLPRGEEPYEGLCMVQFLIGKQGQIEHLQWLGPPDASPEFRECMFSKLRRWRFKPATRHGKPVPVYYNVTVADCAYARAKVKGRKNR